MDEREKTIKGLECCGETMNCNECPYDSEMGGCFRSLKIDALSLLKDEEPRVLGLEELPLGSPDEPKLVYIEVPEDEEGYGEWRGYGEAKMNDGIDVYFAVIGKQKLLLCDTDSYNLTWRCWNTRPTDKQRDEVRWNEKNVSAD